jgi:hypothetical protein
VKGTSVRVIIMAFRTMLACRGEEEGMESRDAQSFGQAQN